MKIGLRIDVDTLRGTRDGVPNLCKVLAAHSIRATFFVSVGPDNMGRHVWRLLRPAFLLKMLRSGAPSLYGWDILLRGTFWPGPVIGDRLAPIIRAAANAGHELGLHAWDHQAWQAHIDAMTASEIARHLARGVEAFTRITGQAPTCSATPGWKTTDAVLREKAKLPFRYNSDCRGRRIFRPVVDGHALAQPQIPVTLPTYDEVIGRQGVTDATYNAYLLSQLDSAGLNVLTIHAEVEGMSRLALFGSFLERVKAAGHQLVPLRDLLDDAADIPCAAIKPQQLAGREGWVAVEEEHA